MAENVRTEWGVEWTDATAPAERYEECPDEAYARRVAKQYRALGAKVVRREVVRKAWAAAE
jgi:hypothetical protein